MDQQRNLIIAIALSIAILFGFQYIFPQPHPSIQCLLLYDITGLQTLNQQKANDYEGAPMTAWLVAIAFLLSMAAWVSWDDVALGRTFLPFSASRIS